MAAYWGGEGGKPVPILVAGRDFGLVVDAPPVLAAAPKRPARYVEHKSAQPSTSWLSGGLCQSQAAPTTLRPADQPIPRSYHAPASLGRSAGRAALAGLMQACFPT